MEDKKAPIPVPPSHRWKEFRIQFLPYALFIILVILIALLWKQVVTPTGILGEVGAVRYEVRSLMDGTLNDLKTELYGTVTKGDDLGVVNTITAETLQAQLAVIRADLEVLRLRTGIDVNQIQYDVSKLQIDRLQVKTELEIAKASVPLRKAEFDRAQSLLAQKVMSQADYDVAKAQYEVAQTTVEQKSIQVSDLDKRIQGAGDVKFNPGSQGEIISQAIQAKERELELASRPVVLKSPGSGVISKVLRQSGEKVRAGEPILEISSTNAAFIVGYVRQPISHFPQVGESVNVRSRASRRNVAIAKVIHVGSQMDYVNPAIISPDNNRVEKALPITVSIPSGMHLVPGEFVDLNFATN